MSTLDIAQYDAIGLAEGISNRDFTVHEVLDGTVARIEALDPSIGAVTLLAEGMAREQAASLDFDAPFAGVPLLIKDLGAKAAGLPQSAGCRYLRERAAPPARDDALMSAYRAAGCLLLGTTTVPEFGLNLTTEPMIGPICRNPWNHQRSAGGSSGRSAAAVAAGMVPVAHATDAGGSIRVPAACCGLVGLKPGRDVMPQGPDFGNHLFGLASEHVVARTVRDSAAIFALTRVEGGRKATRDHVLEALEQAPQGLRIGLLVDDSDDWTIAAACGEATRKTAALLEALGHVIEPLEARALSRHLQEAARVFSVMVCANLAYEVDRMTPAPGDEELEPITWAAAERGRALDAKALVAASRAMLDIAHRTASLFERIDVLLTPALAMALPPLGAFPTDHGDLDRHFGRLNGFAPFAALFNVTGQPAISLPAGLDADGLPLAVQLAGPRGAETLLLRLAAQIEQSAPWPRLAPVAKAGAAA